MISVALIGCGGMGNYHGSELAKLPNVTVAGTCDLIPEKAKALADKIGIDRYCTDFRTLLPEVDAVWVCTEPFNRLDIVTTAAQAGKHIFTEKPIARSLADADAMIAAARTAGVQYMLGYCLRYWQPYRLLHDTFASGELGELASCWMRRFMMMDPPRWYGRQELSGGVMLDFGSHDIDWLRWIGGEVQTVFGKTFRIRDGVQADDHGGAVFAFKNGGMATIENSWSSYMGESTLGIIRIGHDGEEQVVDIETVTAVNPHGEVGERDETGNIRKVQVRNESIHQHFFRCIEEKIKPLTSAEDGRQTLLTAMAIWESARTGKSVDVDSMIGASL